MNQVHPDVSARKVERELELWDANAETYSRRGWIMLRREPPVLEVALLARLPVGGNIVPAVAACVQIDFTNFDLWAPSVEFIDPIGSSSRNATRRRAAQLRHGRSGCATHPGQELGLFFQDGVLIAIGAHSPRNGIRGPIACQALFPPTDLGLRLSASLSPGSFDLPCSARAAIHRVAPGADFAPSIRSSRHGNGTTTRFPTMGPPGLEPGTNRL